MQMLYGYDVAADLAPADGYDEVVQGARRRRRDRDRPAPDRARPRPRLRVRRALPGQRHHRRRRGLPARHLRDLRRRASVRRRAGRDGLRARVGEITVAAYARRSPGARRTRTSRSCATPPPATARPSCGSPSTTTGALLGTVTHLPAGLAVARDGRRRRGRVPDARGGAGRARLGRRRGAGRLVPRPGPRAEGARGDRALEPARRWPRAHRLYERLGFDRAPERDWEPVPRVQLIAFRLRPGAHMTEGAGALQASADLHRDRRRHGGGARLGQPARARHPAAAGLVRGGHLRRDRAGPRRGRDQRRHPGRARAPRRQPGRARASR